MSDKDVICRVHLTSVRSQGAVLGQNGVINIARDSLNCFFSSSTCKLQIVSALAVRGASDCGACLCNITREKRKKKARDINADKRGINVS